MRRDTIPNVVGSLVVFIVPLTPAPDRLAHPAPWIGLATMLVILFSQPAIDTSQMVSRDALDRRSALAILIGMVAPQLAGVIEYGYAPWAFREIDPRFATGLALVALGLALRIWAIRTLGTAFTSTVAVAPGQHVVRTGPYRRIRHPSYTGALVTALGLSLVLGAPLAFALVVLVAGPTYAYRIRIEEAALARGLGRAYEDYMAGTRRLIPFIY